jgi:hypothetical protein
MSGPSINFPIGEFPIRKEATREIQEERNFEVCQPKESILKSGRLFKKKKYVYVHLKETDDEARKWSVLVVSPDEEPKHYSFDV